MWNHQGYSRRSLLKHLGLGGSAFFLPALRPRTAHAAPPKRVVVFYTFQGWYYPECLPSGSGTNWTNGPTHTPLDPWRHKILMPNGVDLVGGGKGEAHGVGETVALTGVPAQAAGAPGSISFDQFVANGFAKNGPSTLLRSLDLRVVSRARGYDNPGVGHKSFASALAAGQPTPLEASPAKAFARLFPKGPATPMTGGDDGSLAELTAYRQRRKSVLDFVAKEFSATNAKLSADDRTKLDQHGTLVRELEQRLVDQGPGDPTTPSAECGSLQSQTFASADDLDNVQHFKTLCDQQFSIIQTAFACDLARVAMLSVSFPPGELFGFKPGDDGIDHEHNFCHRYESHGSDKPAHLVQKLLDGYKEYAVQFANLLQKLDAVKEADGTSVLDNTAVLWCGQIAKGLHNLKGGRWLIAGSLGGALKTGHHFKDVTVTKNGDVFSTITSKLGLGNFNGQPVSAFMA
jgi:hypothetical protein